MKMLYAAVIMLMSIALLLGVYSQTSNSFDFNNSNGFTQCPNGQESNGQCIGQSNAIIYNANGNIINTTIITTTSTTTTQTSNPCALTSSPFGCITFKLTALIDGFFCNFNLGSSCANAAVANQQAGVLQNGGNYIQALNAGQTTTNNSYLSVLGNPLTEATLVATVFIGLGIFAGLLGAGFLAQVMASVGIGMAMVTYIEGQLTTFQQLPPIVFYIFNGYIGMMLVIMIWETFQGSPT